MKCHVLVDISMAPMALAIIGKILEIKISSSAISHRYRIINAIEARQPDNEIALKEGQYLWTIWELDLIENSIPWLIASSVILFTLGVWLT